MAQFKDPNSPFHIPPGEVGPSDENDHSTSRPLPHHPVSADLSVSGGPSGPSTPSAGATAGSSVSGLDDATLERGREGAKAYFAQEGYDLRGSLEWPVAWGDCDMFQ